MRVRNGALLKAPRALALTAKRLALSYRNWTNPISALWFFLIAAGFSKDLTRLARFRLGELTIHVRPADCVAFEEIALRGEYRFLFDVFSESPPRRVLDLGANVGVFSAFILSRWCFAEVHSVEASSDTHKVLARNCAANAQFNWSAYHYAVWDSDGEIGFDTSPTSTGRRIAKGGGETVRAITLESFLARHLGSADRLSLVKVDIEGAEQAVLESSAHLLDRIDHLVLEVHPGHCDGTRVIELVRSCFDRVYAIPQRQSKKPLLVACRRDLPFWKALA